MQAQNIPSQDWDAAPAAVSLVLAPTAPRWVPPSVADTAAFLAIAALHAVLATTFDAGAKRIIERALREIEALT